MFLTESTGLRALLFHERFVDFVVAEIFILWAIGYTSDWINFVDASSIWMYRRHGGRGTGVGVGSIASFAGVGTSNSHSRPSFTVVTCVSVGGAPLFFVIAVQCRINYAANTRCINTSFGTETTESRTSNTKAIQPIGVSSNSEEKSQFSEHFQKMILKRGDFSRNPVLLYTFGTVENSHYVCFNLEQRKRLLKNLLSGGTVIV